MRCDGLNRRPLREVRARSGGQTGAKRPLLPGPAFRTLRYRNRLASDRVTASRRTL